MLSREFAEVDVVFHCAAMKHVTLCEYSPYKAIQTNILGVHNVINAALDNEVKQVVFTSSDKAAMSAEEVHDYIVENRLIEDLEDGRLA